MSASSRWAAVLTSPACPNVAPSDHPLLPHPGNSRYLASIPHRLAGSLAASHPDQHSPRCPKSVTHICPTVLPQPTLFYHFASTPVIPLSFTAVGTKSIPIPHPKACPKPPRAGRHYDAPNASPSIPSLRPSVTGWGLAGSAGDFSRSQSATRLPGFSCHLPE